MALAKKTEMTGIFRALGNPKYTWRTIPAIAKETGLEAQAVREFLLASADDVIQSKVPSANGDDLFTTRARLKPIVIKALESPRHTWRTILGIASDTGLDWRTVEQVITSCGDEIVTSKKPSDQGEQLFTTRTHLAARQNGSRKKKNK